MSQYNVHVLNGVHCNVHKLYITVHYCTAQQGPGWRPAQTTLPLLTVGDYCKDCQLAVVSQCSVTSKLSSLFLNIQYSGFCEYQLRGCDRKMMMLLHPTGLVLFLFSLYVHTYNIFCLQFVSVLVMNYYSQLIPLFNVNRMLNNVVWRPDCHKKSFFRP